MESPRESESSKDRGRYKSCREKEENVNSHHQVSPLVMHKEAVKWFTSVQFIGAGWKTRALVTGWADQFSR